MARKTGWNRGSGYCPYCRQRRPGKWDSSWRSMNVTLTVLTCGAWLAVWLILGGDRYVCDFCGGRLR